MYMVSAYKTSYIGTWDFGDIAQPYCPASWLIQYPVLMIRQRFCCSPDLMDGARWRQQSSPPVTLRSHAAVTRTLIMSLAVTALLSYILSGGKSRRRVQPSSFQPGPPRLLLFVSTITPAVLVDQPNMQINKMLSSTRGNWTVLLKERFISSFMRFFSAVKKMSV